MAQGLSCKANYTCSKAIDRYVRRVTARFGRIESAGDPRILRFALKLGF